MKKKIILGLLVIVGLFTITGCSKGTKTDDNKTLFNCVKNNISDGDSDSTTRDIKRSAKVDDDGKLLYYTNDFIYYYDSEDKCNEWCDIKTKWYKDMEEKNYSGLKNTVNCSCSKEKSLEAKSEYDITNLDSFLRDDIPNMKDDNTFELEEWINKYKKGNYNCN